MDAFFQLAVIWACVFLSEIAAHKTRLTPVLYFLFFGAVFANLGLIPFEASESIRTLSEIGIVLIMFALGFEENAGKFIKAISRSWGIALFGALSPFCAAYFLALWFWKDTNVALMCGLAMSATAVSLSMISLRSLGLHKTPAATGIMTAAVIDHVSALVFVAILLPIAIGETATGPAGLAWILVKAFAFFVIVTLLGAWIFPQDPQGWAAKIPLLQRSGLKHVLAFADGRHATLTLLLLAVVVGILAHEFGFHPAVGAYMAGLIIQQEFFHFHSYPKINYYEKTKEIIDNVAFSWIGPIFFVVLGAQLKFDWDIVVEVIPISLAFIAALMLAQVTSACLAARYTGRFKWHDSLLIGLGMLGRAELAFVVIDIAYVQHDILSTQAFYTLMFTAFWLNVAVPVSTSIWKKLFNAAENPAPNFD